jgi:hypothetical protein
MPAVVFREILGQLDRPWRRQPEFLDEEDGQTENHQALNRKATGYALALLGNAGNPMMRKNVV